MTSESRTENGATLTSVFTYDPLGQLTSFTRSDGQSESYTYDPVGNMTAKTQNGVSTAMRYNAANQLTQSVTNGDTITYTYDANGSLVKSENAGGARSYAYNALGLLAKFTREDGYTETYTYNANCLLSTIKTSEDLTTMLTWDILYGDGVVISEKRGDQATSYTYGLERISAKTGSTRTEYVYDGRGSVAAEVSYNNAWYTFGGGLARKNVVSKSYSPFGELLTEQTSGFGYNGEYYNAATGMIYLRARFYEPEMNRFAQKDVIRGSILDPLGLNRYPYCANDPINFCDPSGMAIVRNTMVQMADGGGSGKSSTTPKKTPATSSASTPPLAYTNPYQEYAEQRRAATTPSAQDYAQLMRSGVHMSYAQYAYEKSHTVFPSYVDYMNGKQTGRPYYTTYNQNRVNHIFYPLQYYSATAFSNPTISKSTPSVKSYFESFVCLGGEMALRYYSAREAYNLNIQKLDNIPYDDSGHINGQKLDGIQDLLFGVVDAGYAACEAIAVYNALIDTGIETNLADIIFAAQVNNYMLLGGRWGINPYKVNNLLKDYGISSRRVYDTLISNDTYQEGQVFIASIWNDAENPLAQVHTFEIVFTPDNERGAWTVYNRGVYDKEARYYNSFNDILSFDDMIGSYITVYEVQKP